MSVGRAICLVQKLGLSNLDVEDTRLKHLSLPAHDWIELEEGRRTFWAAFYADRWASTMTGWPMILDETKVSRILAICKQWLTLSDQHKYAGFRRML